jgi:NADH-quinone oxidoreductase subunit E
MTARGADGQLGLVLLPLGPRPDESGRCAVEGAPRTYPPEVRDRLEPGAKQINRYPQPRSALLPLPHLVQAGYLYLSPAGLRSCDDQLGMTGAEIAEVATFYTMYRRKPAGDYLAGVCPNTLCAVVGGDAIFAALKDHLGIGNDDTTLYGRISLQYVECNAACDYAPAVMVNREFFDNQTPKSACELVDALRAGERVRPSRGMPLCPFRRAERILAGFPDHRADGRPGWPQPGRPGRSQSRGNKATRPERHLLADEDIRAVGRRWRHCCRYRQAARHFRHDSRKVVLRVERWSRQPDYAVDQLLTRRVFRVRAARPMPVRCARLDARPAGGGGGMTVTGGQTGINAAGTDLVTLTIDGVEVPVPKGTTVIRAAELIGVTIDPPVLRPPAARTGRRVPAMPRAQTDGVVHHSGDAQHGGAHAVHVGAGDQAQRGVLRRGQSRVLVQGVGPTEIAVVYQRLKVHQRRRRYP